MKSDGGPAFPNRGDNSKEYPYFDGMTLRDYFAGQALIGLYAAAEMPLQTEDPDLKADAVLAYRIADAMLKARDQS